LLSFATYNDCKDNDDEDSVLMLGKRTFATIFLIKITCVKKLLQKANRKEGEYTPNMVVLGEKTTNLECNIQALIHNLEGRKMSL
jgi:hypothetical protein